MIKKLIEEQVKIEETLKAQEKELNDLRHEQDDLNNIDVLDITYTQFVRKLMLIEYVDRKFNALAKYKQSIVYDNRGPFLHRLAILIGERMDQDEELEKVFKAFEGDHSSKEKEKDYFNAFDKKLNEFYDEVAVELEEYFEIIGNDRAKHDKNKLNDFLPKPRTAGDVEHKIESKKHGIPFQYRHKAGDKHHPQR